MLQVPPLGSTATALDGIPRLPLLQASPSMYPRLSDLSSPTSDFWSNGTRRVTSGLPFNLTASMNKEVDTPVLIPTGAFIGNHNVTSTATWQYSDSSGWHTAAPAVTSVTVNVSQTIGSLLSDIGFLV